MKTDSIPKFAEQVKNTLNIKLFCQESYKPTVNAQRNLNGKSHYVDPDTLSFFRSHINAANVSESGLIFWLIESCSLNSDHSERGFRFVAFDLFGTTIERPNLNGAVSTSEKARKEFYAWLNGFDVIAHYKGALYDLAEKKKREAKEFMKVARFKV